MQQDTGARTIGVAALLTALILSGLVVAYFSTQSNVVIESLFLSLVFPLLLVLRTGKIDTSRGVRAYFVSMVYLVPLLLSLVVNVGTDKNPLFNAALVFNMFCLFLWASVLSSQEGMFWGKTLRFLSIILSLVLLYVVVVQRHAYVWGRWEPYGIQPNWWGMMALGLGWSIFAWRNVLVRVLGAAFVAYFMISVQSRGSIVALVPLILFGSRWFFPLSVGKLARLVVLAVTLLGAAVVWDIYNNADTFGSMNQFISNDVLLLHNKFRGLGSGMSGRLSGYREAIHAFMEHPVLGNGINRFNHVHNGFLIVLAESGIFAFLGMLLLILRGLFLALKAGRWESIGYILSYMTVIMTFPRTFNINMTSILFIFVMMAEYSRSNRAVEATEY